MEHECHKVNFATIVSYHGYGTSYTYHAGYFGQLCAITNDSL